MLQKETEEKKRQERLASHKKRGKYWQLVRDLYPPKVSDLKKEEMKQLIGRVENPRVLAEQKQRNLKNNSSTRNDAAKAKHQNYFSSGVYRNSNMGRGK